jgi:hypothetical protein
VQERLNKQPSHLVFLFAKIKRFNDTFVKPANNHIFVKRDNIFIFYKMKRQTKSKNRRCMSKLKSPKKQDMTFLLLV